MINLEAPKKHAALIDQAHQVAMNMLRPISRKYDLAEHEYPKELDMLAAMIDGLDSSGASEGAGATGVRRDADSDDKTVKNGANLASVMSVAEMCWGDVGLLLTMPRQGLGNSAIASVANDEQLARFKGTWAAMAITEPGTGSDSANIITTAIKDGDEYVLNGEKIFVTSGDRADLIVVWASLDRSKGRAAIKSFIVERDNPGLKLDRLEHKLGIRASDTAMLILEDCRVPLDNILGSPEIPKTSEGFKGVMATFDATRPAVAASAIGIGRAAIEFVREALDKEGMPIRYGLAGTKLTAVERDFMEMENLLQAARLLTWRAAWMMDRGLRNNLEASMAKAKAGLAVTQITQKAVEILGPRGYSRSLLVEKWMRDAKINDIFEGTQQINMMIVARRILGYSSRELS